MISCNQNSKNWLIFSHEAGVSRVARPWRAEESLCNLMFGCDGLVVQLLNIWGGVGLCSLQRGLGCGIFRT